ncbi:1-acyl-sn-glycerol-3-phosphate acyltransferase [Faecalibacterium sp. An122]|nr:1-acyl-sn-glycerol-3-phosphate acyltransferase [Faecalibacterium sp. An122]
MKSSKIQQTNWEGTSLQILYILRTIAMYVYMFGYMLLFYGTLRRAEKAAAAGDRETVRQIVNYHIPRWCRGLLRVAGVKMTVEGVENIPASGPVVFVGNHRSYFDIPIMLVALDHPHGILAKEELANIPLLSRWMNLLGCVYVKREDVRGSLQALKDASDVVKNGESFTIFPEGTRYKGVEGGAGEFKAGAFRIAIKTGAPVVPVAISGARALYEDHGCIVRPGSVRVTILPAIRTAGMKKEEQTQLPQAVRQNILAAMSRLGQTIL